MPRDPELVLDASRRLKVTRQRARRFPFPVPNGWFVVAQADDLAPGEVRALYFFARDLVLYRGDDGEPHVVDAHCPHLGAHLGVGGKVEGECLRCPFHGWRSTAPTASASRSPTATATASRPRPTPGRTRPSSATG